MKSADKRLPKGITMNGGACGGFAEYVERKIAKEAIVNYANDVIDEILGMYVEDGNPLNWKEKILEFKKTVK